MSGATAGVGGGQVAISGVDELNARLTRMERSASANAAIALAVRSAPTVTAERPTACTVAPGLLSNGVTAGGVSCAKYAGAKGGTHRYMSGGIGVSGKHWGVHGGYTWSW